MGPVLFSSRPEFDPNPWLGRRRRRSPRRTAGLTPLWGRSRGEARDRPEMDGVESGFGNPASKYFLHEIHQKNNLTPKK